MSPSTLPTLSRAEVESHNNHSSCYVSLGRKVYDVTDFVDDHPGGGELILKYGGKDITAILRDVASHAHSESAYEILDDFIVGLLDARDPAGSNSCNGRENVSQNTVIDEKMLDQLDDQTHPEIETLYDNSKGLVQDENGRWVHPRTGMACEEDLSNETNPCEDFKRYKFLDLNKPLFLQIWNGGFSKKFYLDQVHRPRHYKGGKSAPLFGNFLEPLSLTPWWLVPLLWLPCIGFFLYKAHNGLEDKSTAPTCFLGGLLFWTFVEYMMHRFLFHLDDWLPDNRVAITLHFLLHGIHHYLPMDKYRLVMPPALLMVLAYPFYRLAHLLFWWNSNIATAVLCGGVFGYVCYDLTHYFLHHRNLPLWYQNLKKYHLAHHFLDYELGFGVTSKFWDRVFGTELIVIAKSTN